MGQGVQSSELQNSYSQPMAQTLAEAPFGLAPQPVMSEGQPEQFYSTQPTVQHLPYHQSYEHPPMQQSFVQSVPAVQTPTVLVNEQAMMQPMVETLHPPMQTLMQMPMQHMAQHQFMAESALLAYAPPTMDVSM